MTLVTLYTGITDELFVLPKIQMTIYCMGYNRAGGAGPASQAIA